MKVRKRKRKRRRRRQKRRRRTPLQRELEWRGGAEGVLEWGRGVEYFFQEKMAGNALLGMSD